MKYLTNLDLNKNELQNTVIQNLGAAPSSPKKGQIYMDSGLNRAFVWDGTNWIGMDSYDAEMTGADIVSAINASSSLIDVDNLANDAQTAVANSHTHSNKAILDATTASFLIADETKLDGIEAGAQVNTVTSVAGRTGAVVVTKSDVGLSSVTNDAQVKKIASSTNGYIPTWNGNTGDLLATGYSVETTLSGGTGAIPRADAVKSYVDNLLSASDAMVFKGTLGTGGNITTLPTTYSAGWTYKVITNGTYAGIVAEIGDLIIAVIDRAGSGNLNSDWTIVQTNIDGAVTGPSSSISLNFAAFNGTTGKVISDSGYNSSSFAAPADIKNATLTLQVGSAAATNNTVTVGTGTGFSANASTNSTYDIKVGPALTNLASTMTGASVGVVTKTAADTYSLVTNYTKKYSQVLSTSATSYVITHNLNTQDASVVVRENNGTFAQVYCDVEFTSVNTVTLRFAVAPTANDYKVIVIG